jgi:hypothetical protein
MSGQSKWPGRTGPANWPTHAVGGNVDDDHGKAEEHAGGTRTDPDDAGVGSKGEDEERDGEDDRAEHHGVSET